MNNKAFTLIELLAVITILSIIVLIVSISLSDVLKESKNDLTNSQIKAIEEAANTWSADNFDILPSGNSCSFLTLRDLKDDGVLDEEIIDPKNRKNISDNLKIKIISKINGNGKSILTYEVNPKDINDCTYIGGPLYVDISSELTPVIYDGTNWRVPKLDEEWYNYGNQMWANAVILKKGKTKKPGDIVTVEGNNPDALIMLVYVPRYEYRIVGEYGTHADHVTGSAALPGEIEVKFINNSQTKADDDYILHPAFIFGDKQLSGIWVGKFEISHATLSSSTTANNLGCSTINCINADGLRTLPNVPSLRYNSVSNFWYAIKSIENRSNTFGLTNMDTHMIKNVEWGAVAYLSQSEYGKYGNNDYEREEKEIYQNKSQTFMTGNSNGTPSQTDFNTQCEYDNDTDNCGVGASTTGNVYGIYDMSGGADEYVMGVLGTNKSPTLSSSGFSGTDIFENDVINSKYYYIYSNPTSSATDDAKKSCNGGICYGHALSETYNWYYDSNFMPTSSASWIMRGGRYSNSSAPASGIFFYSNATGGSNLYLSTRIILVSKH